jgi:hypothetical protein
MGNKQSSVEKTSIEEIKYINVDDLDLSKIDALQLKAIKQMAGRIETLEKEKQTKMIYALPKIDVCNYSLF